MRTRIDATSFTLWLSARETYDWASKIGGAWPCSTIRGRSVMVQFDANGLLWGVADQLYTIKLQTGEPQAVGQATCESVRGLETANGFCMADCDRSTGIGTLDVFDFLCFQYEFVRSRAYACDCDTSTGSGVCDIFDFLCFQTRFIGGCK